MFVLRVSGIGWSQRPAQGCPSALRATMQKGLKERRAVSAEHRFGIGLRNPFRSGFQSRSMTQAARKTECAEIRANNGPQVCHRQACTHASTQFIAIPATADVVHGRAIFRDRSMPRGTYFASVLATAFAAAVLLVSGVVRAQTDFPSRRIHVIVPYPAGGIVDIATRIVSDKLAEIWRQPIVVEAKPGANGNIGWDQVARAEPDGYTWTFLGPATMANPRMYAKLSWSEKSFLPVGAMVWAPSTLVVHPSLPVGTMTEFIDYVRAHPGVLNWGSPGTGTSQHLNAAIFLNATKLTMLAVPYGGQPPAIVDLMANRIQFMVASTGLVAQHINSGALKPLAVLSTTRSPLIRSVPTMTEAGYPEVNVVAWYGYGVPRGTPGSVIDKIAAGFNQATKDAKVRELLEKQALQPIEPMTLGQIAELYAADTEKYAKVIRETGLRLSE
jgi:tripartite-type tricarboxylate transporter receptor subunit TctC